VQLQRRLAVRLVAALVTDEPVAAVDDRDVGVEFGDDEEGFVAHLALVRPNAGVTQHVDAQETGAGHRLTADAAQQRVRTHAAAFVDILVGL